MPNSSQQRFSLQTKKNWATPSVRRKMLQHLKTFSKSPEQRLANSARTGVLDIHGCAILATPVPPKVRAAGA